MNRQTAMHEENRKGANDVSKKGFTAHDLQDSQDYEVGGNPVNDV